MSPRLRAQYREIIGRLFKKAEAETMAKKTSVKFTLGDGLKPTRVHESQTLNLRCPVPLKVPAQTQIPLRLGITCSHPLQVFQPSSFVSRTLKIVEGATVWDAGQELRLVIENVGSIPTYIEGGETVARAHVLDDASVEVL